MFIYRKQFLVIKLPVSKKKRSTVKYISNAVLQNVENAEVDEMNVFWLDILLALIIIMVIIKIIIF